MGVRCFLCSKVTAAVAGRLLIQIKLRPGMSRNVPDTAAAHLRSQRGDKT